MKSKLEQDLEKFGSHAKAIIYHIAEVCLSAPSDFNTHVTPISCLARDLQAKYDELESGLKGVGEDIQAYRDMNLQLHLERDSALMSRAALQKKCEEQQAGLEMSWAGISLLRTSHAGVVQQLNENRALIAKLHDLLNDAWEKS